MPQTTRYNVIIDVSIDAPDTSKANSAIRQELKQMEKEAENSARRVNDNINASNRERARQSQKFSQDELNSFETSRGKMRAIEDDAIDFQSRARRKSTNEWQQDLKRQEKVWQDTLNYQVASRKAEAKEQQRISKESLEYAVASAKAKTAQEQRIAKESLEYAVASAKERTKIRQQEVADINEETKKQARQQRELRELTSKNLQAGIGGVNDAQRKQFNKDFDRDLSSITKKTKESSEAFGVWGRAFRGAFIGAVAGITFSTIISGITSIANAIKEALVSSIQLASEFEKTRNAMIVFTGSARLANQELGVLSNLARATVGLRLEDAEQGALRLRALGFEAKTVYDLVVGLGKQKVLSGADEQALNRVIVNITQLASGSPRLSQDIKEMIQSFPTLRLSIIDTFGSLEKFKQGLRDDPEKTLEQFAKGIKNTEVAEAGLSDATGKLLDEFIRAGRNFGEPILDPLTDDVRELTTYLQDNESGWKQWGQSTGDAIRGVGVAFEYLSALSGVTPKAILARTAVASGTFGISEAIIGIFNSLEQVGQADRKDEEDFQKKVDAITYGKLSDAEKEALVNQNRAERKLAEDREKDRLKEIQNLETFGKQKIDLLQNQFKVENAIINARETRNTQDRLANARDLANVQRRQIQDDFKAQQAYYAQLIQLQDGNQQEIEKITLEKNKVLSGLATEYVLNEINSAKEIRDLEKQILEERRNNLIEFKELEIQTVIQANNRLNFELEKSLAEGLISYDQYFDRQTSAIEDAYTKTLQLQREQLALELENEKLTQEEIINIKKSYFLEEERLTLEKEQRLFDIQQERIEKQKAQIQQLADFRSSITSIGANILTDFSNLFLGEGSTSARSTETLDYILNFAQKRIDDIDVALSSVFRSVPFGGELSDKQTEVIKKLESEKKLLEESQDRIKPFGDFIKQQFEGFVPTAQGVDALERDRLLQQQKAETLAINNRIASEEKLIPLIQDSAEKERARYNLIVLKQERDSIGIKQLREQEELFRKSIDGLEEYNKALQKGDKQATAFVLNRAEKQLLEEQSNELETIIALKLRLSKSPLIDAEKIEIAQLEKLLSLRSEYTNLIIRQNNAQIEIAQQGIYNELEANVRLLEFFAQQKSLTDIVTDTRINLLNSAYSGLERTIGRLTDKMGLFGDVVRQTLTDLIKFALNPILRRLFGIEGGASSGLAGGGANIGGAVGGLLTVGSGNVIFGGTPQFNPNAGGLNVSNIFSSINTPLFSGGGLHESAHAGAGVVDGSGRIIEAGATQAGSSVFGGTGIATAIGSLAPFLGASLGGLVGGNSIGGGILGSAGGLIGGGVLSALIGGSLTGASTGGIFGSIGGLLGIGAGATAGLALALAPLLLLGGFFFGRSKRRRQEERIRNQAMGEALRALDNLIDDVRFDRIDGASAIASAEQIRANYVEQMSQLKDKKTRRIALADVSRLDSKISTLRTAVDEQNTRRERLELLVPTFAQGGSIGAGYLSGLGTSTSDSNFGYTSSGYPIRFSDGEYMLDAETTSNIGRTTLDVIRASKGLNLASVVRERSISSGASTPSSSSGGNNGVAEVHLTVINQMGEQEFVKVVDGRIHHNDGSITQLNKIGKGMQDNNTQLNNQVRKIANGR